MTDSISEKQQQYNAAMAKYDQLPGYQWVGRLVSFLVVGIQVVLAAFALRQDIGVIHQVITFAAAYILADFVNGVVHLYMDRTEDYTSLAGPLNAAFHLHHRTPRYTQKPLYRVYYHESGSKVWLMVFEVCAVAAVWQGMVTGVAAYGVVYFSILSSVAEVSHYLCHVPPQSRIAGFLGKIGLLLNPRHHARHHIEDNVSYAFLNAMTDPVINGIARYTSSGYKTTTDLHYARYAGPDTGNRQ